MKADIWDGEILGTLNFGIDAIYIGNDTYSYEGNRNVIYRFESVEYLKLML